MSDPDTVSTEYRISADAPNLILRAIWFVLIGWWLTGVLSAAAWALNATIIGPTLLQIGTNEMLRNDSFALADALREAGVPVWVQVWDQAMHMFQLSFDVNPDARKAVAEIVAFFEYATTQQPGEVAS